MDRWVGKVAIVTGASSGIGASVAEQLVKSGLKVVGFARRSELIEERAKTLSGCKGKLLGYKVDMTIEQDIIDGFDWTTKNVGAVHILINNAGIAEDTSLVDGDTLAWKKVLDTNVLSMVIATRKACTIMKANSIDGHIVNINSILGFILLLNTQSPLITNVLDKNSTCWSISPGIVKTNIWDNANEITKNRVKDQPFLKPEDIADDVMYALSTPPHMQIHELTMQVVGETVF